MAAARRRFSPPETRVQAVPGGTGSDPVGTTDEVKGITCSRCGGGVFSRWPSWLSGWGTGFQA